MTFFEIHNARVWRGENKALDDFSLALRAGESTAVLGPNGAGKSTFLKLLTGEVRPEAGRGSRCKLFGEELWSLEELRHRIGVEVELARREALYRGDRPRPAVAGRRVILVDDGVATGATMRAAVRALRAQLPSDLVVAAPVIAADTARALAAEVTRVVAVLIPADLMAVGQYYADFRQTTDEEVRDLLRAAVPAGPRAAAVVPPDRAWHYRTLRALRDHLLTARGDRLRETTEPLEAASAHGVDFSDEVHDRELAATLPADRGLALAAVEAALERFTDGTYGLCQRTGRPIPRAQLRACPWRTTADAAARHPISHDIAQPPPVPRRT